MAAAASAVVVATEEWLQLWSMNSGCGEGILLNRDRIIFILCLVTGKGTGFACKIEILQLEGSR